MLQTEVRSSKNIQSAKLSMAVGLFQKIGFLIKRKPTAWDFRAKTRIFLFTLHFCSAFSFLRMFQNFHLTTHAFWAYTKTRAVLQSKKENVTLSLMQTIVTNALL